MVQVDISHNRFYADNVEFVEWACGTDSGPAHYQKIDLVGVSPNNRYFVSLAGGKSVKVWDRHKPRLSQRISQFELPPSMTPVDVIAVADDAFHVAVVHATGISLLKVSGNFSNEVDRLTCPPREWGKIKSIVYSHYESLITVTNENGKTATFSRKWKLEE